MVKSEIRAIHIWQADENVVCQLAGHREHDFAISITFSDNHLKALTFQSDAR
jgi:hypothetical protein